MFKHHINHPNKYNNDISPINKFISTNNRPISPLKKNKTDQIITHKERNSRSPIRNRPSDIMFLKNYIDVNLNKRK
jgi:hypothetical protein